MLLLFPSNILALLIKSTTVGSTILKPGAFVYLLVRNDRSGRLENGVSLALFDGQILVMSRPAWYRGKWVEQLKQAIASITSEDELALCEGNSSRARR